MTTTVKDGDVFSVRGPAAAMKFRGDFKEQCGSIPYVSATWINAGDTMVAMMLEGGAKNADAAVAFMTKHLGVAPYLVWFAEEGMDIVFKPHGQN